MKILDRCTREDVAPIEFSRPAEEVGFLLGTTDMWLGATTANEESPPWLGFGPVPLRPWTTGR